MILIEHGTFFPLEKYFIFIRLIQQEIEVMILEKLKLKQSYNTEQIKKLDKQTDKSKTLKRNLRYLRFYA